MTIQVFPFVVPTTSDGGSGSGTVFLTDTLSDLDSNTYYYYGGNDSDSNWKVNRYLKTDLNTQVSANQTSNASYTTLTSAWAARQSLIYM